MTTVSSMHYKLEALSRCTLVKRFRNLARIVLLLVTQALNAAAIPADDFEGSETLLVEAFKTEGTNAFDLDSSENAFGLVNAPEGILVVITRTPSERTLELLCDRRVLEIDMTTAIANSGQVFNAINSKLRSLVISVPEFSTTPIELNRFERLSRLTMRGAGLTDRFVSSTVFPSNLESLLLESDFLTGKGCRSALEASTNLESLYVSSKSLTSIDPQTVRSHKKLVVLNLPDTAMTLSPTETLFGNSNLDRIITRDYAVFRRRVKLIGAPEIKSGAEAFGEKREFKW